MVHACLRLWKTALQQLADKTGLIIQVCHYPPRTSKWNKIEHRMFCCITQNWRAMPLVSLYVVIALIANTTTKKGLSIRCELDPSTYPKGLKIPDAEMAKSIGTLGRSNEPHGQRGDIQG
jgi:Rhodopirellula transposase DDE domain